MCGAATNAADSTKARSNTCASGRYDRMRSSLLYFSEATTPSAALVIRPKLCITPFGVPVDPEV